MPGPTYNQGNGPTNPTLPSPTNQVNRNAGVPNANEGGSSTFDTQRSAAGDLNSRQGWPQGRPDRISPEDDQRPRKLRRVEVPSRMPPPLTRERDTQVNAESTMVSVRVPVPVQEQHSPDDDSSTQYSTAEEWSELDSDTDSTDAASLPDDNNSEPTSEDLRQV